MEQKNDDYDENILNSIVENNENLLDTEFSSEVSHTSYHDKYQTKSLTFLICSNDAISLRPDKLNSV